MFLCDACGKENLTYKKIENNWYISCDCGRIEKVIPVKRNCIHCGAEYEQINWNIPSSCDICNYSFID